MDYPIHGMPRSNIREEWFLGISVFILGESPSGIISIRSLVSSIKRTWLHFGHFALSRKRLCSTSLRFAQYGTISYPETLYRAKLTLTDQMQLNCSFVLSRCLPTHYYPISCSPRSVPLDLALKIVTILKTSWIQHGSHRYYIFTIRNGKVTLTILTNPKP